MAGHDKERDRGHDHRSNGSTVQAASAELARQGTEDLRRLSSFLGSTPVAPAILDDASALPQGDGGTRPAFAGSAERGEPDLIVLDASDILHDAFAVRRPGIDAEGEMSSWRSHLRLLLPHSSSAPHSTAGVSSDVAEVRDLGRIRLLRCNKVRTYHVCPHEIWKCACWVGLHRSWVHERRSVSCYRRARQEVCCSSRQSVSSAGAR